MSNKFGKKSDSVPAMSWLLVAVVLILAAALLAPTPALTAKYKSFEGIIQGANCVHNKTGCPESPSDPHVAAEHDFVLLMPDGSHYFLLNLNRPIKAQYVTMPVRVTGEIQGEGIWVHTMEVKKDGKYKLVWSFEEEERLRQRELQMYRGGN
ncbi:MAG: hypothetical protein JRJ12_17285 [Deltaproteobacteria bacterium]|nr:hypothetical protein [Deltaproteobacteria bacterium]MBW2073005.1 hypothetical protein [Deltaproteobacteria bacterium]